MNKLTEPGVGTLKMSSDITYWEGKRASVFPLSRASLSFLTCSITRAIYASGMTGATIHSTTKSGAVDGSGQKFWEVNWL